MTWQNSGPLQTVVASLKRTSDVVQQQDDSPAVLKAFWIWLAVGLSQMSPLQFVQFLAGIFAIVYSALQIYKLVRELWFKKDKP